MKHFISRLWCGLATATVVIVLAAIALLAMPAMNVGAERVPVSRIPDPNERPDKDMVRFGTVKTDAKQLPGRAPIYDPEADARAEIRAALVRAHYTGRRVLVQFGANSCAYCYRMYDGLQKHATIAPLFSREYELVMLDASNNSGLLAAYTPGLSTFSIPWLVVLDGDGKALVSQNPEDLGRETNFDPKKIQAFFERWKNEPVDAEQVLASALETAKESQKRVLVHGGAPTAPWSRLLDGFLMGHPDLIGVDYVDIRIDPARMKNAAQLQKRLRAGKPGANWVAILDAKGDVVESAEVTGGKAAEARQSKEIETFLGLIKKSRQNLTDEQLATLESGLREAAASPAKKKGGR